MKVNKIYQQIVELFESRYVLKQLIMQHLTLRYRRTVLGYLWTLVNPLLMMSVTAVVFSTIFNLDLKTFAIYLFAGMIPWTLFSNALTQCATVMSNNEGLLQKVYLPRSIFPLSTVIGLLVDSLLSTAALFMIALILGVKISYALLFLPAAFFLLFMFSLGLGLFIAIFSVYFRDLQHVMVIALQAWFFLTPILYKPEFLKGKVELLISMNPLVPFINLFREPITQGVLPSTDIILKCLIFSSIAFFSGVLYFMRNEKNIVFRL